MINSGLTEKQDKTYIHYVYQSEIQRGVSMNQLFCSHTVHKEVSSSLHSKRKERSKTTTHKSRHKEEKKKAKQHKGL